jgi:NAD-dependent DNA ligase
VSVLTGKRIVLVGSFSAYQYEVVELVESLGGTVSQWIDGSISYVVIGDKSTTSQRNAKVKYAYQNNVPVVTEREFAALIQGSSVAKERQAKIQEQRLNTQGYGDW